MANIFTRGNRRHIIFIINHTAISKFKILALFFNMKGLFFKTQQHERFLPDKTGYIRHKKDYSFKEEIIVCSILAEFEFKLYVVLNLLIVGLHNVDFRMILKKYKVMNEHAFIFYTSLFPTDLLQKIVGWFDRFDCGLAVD